MAAVTPHAPQGERRPDTRGRIAVAVCVQTVKKLSKSLLPLASQRLRCCSPDCAIRCDKNLWGFAPGVQASQAARTLVCSFHTPSAGRFRLLRGDPCRTLPFGGKTSPRVSIFAPVWGFHPLKPTFHSLSAQPSLDGRALCIFPVAPGRARQAALPFCGARAGSLANVAYSLYITTNGRGILRAVNRLLQQCGSFRGNEKRKAEAFRPSGGRRV